MERFFTVAKRIALFLARTSSQQTIDHLVYEISQQISEDGKVPPAALSPETGVCLHVPCAHLSTWLFWYSPMHKRTNEATPSCAALIGVLGDNQRACSCLFDIVWLQSIHLGACQAKAYSEPFSSTARCSFAWLPPCVMQILDPAGL